MSKKYNNYYKKVDYKGNSNYWQNKYEYKYERQNNNYQSQDYKSKSNYWQNKYEYKYNRPKIDYIPKFPNSYYNSENKNNNRKSCDEFKEMNVLNKKRERPKESQKEKDANDNGTVQFFSPNNKNKLNNIIEKLESAKYSLDIAMYTLTNIQLINAILNCFDNKVNIRIILDYNMTKRYGWFLKDLLKKGIYIKTNDNPKELMHNKFAIIDHKLAFNGSLNWSEKGVTKNHENITIFNDEKVIEQFTSQFNKMWVDFGNVLTLYDIEQKGKFYNDKKYMPKYYYRNYNRYKNYFDRYDYRKEQFFEDCDDESDDDSESEEDSEGESEECEDDDNNFGNKGYYNNYRYKKYGYNRYGKY